MDDECEYNERKNKKGEKWERRRENEGQRIG